MGCPVVLHLLREPPAVVVHPDDAVRLRNSHRICIGAGQCVGIDDAVHNGGYTPDHIGRRLTVAVGVVENVVGNHRVGHPQPGNGPFDQVDDGVVLDARVVCVVVNDVQKVAVAVENRIVDHHNRVHGRIVELEHPPVVDRILIFYVAEVAVGDVDLGSPSFHADGQPAAPFEVAVVENVARAVRNELQRLKGLALAGRRAGLEVDVLEGGVIETLEEPPHSTAGRTDAGGKNGGLLPRLGLLTDQTQREMSAHRPAEKINLSGLQHVGAVGIVPLSGGGGIPHDEFVDRSVGLPVNFGGDEHGVRLLSEKPRPASQQSNKQHQPQNSSFSHWFVLPAKICATLKNSCFGRSLSFPPPPKTDPAILSSTIVSREAPIQTANLFFREPAHLQTGTWCPATPAQPSSSPAELRTGTAGPGRRSCRSAARGADSRCPHSDPVRRPPKCCSN